MYWRIHEGGGTGFYVCIFAGANVSPVSSVIFSVIAKVYSPAQAVCHLIPRVLQDVKLCTFSGLYSSHCRFTARRPVA